MTLQDKLKYALSGEDIRKWLPNARIYKYEDFAERVKEGDSLYDILGPAKCAVILYQWKPLYGHWTVVFQQKPGVIECFDALGNVPDNQLTFVPKHFKEDSNQNHTYLLRLLDRTPGITVHYNELPLQEESPDVNTCGKWVITRIAFRQIPLNKFQKMFEGVKRPDEIIAQIL